MKCFNCGKEVDNGLRFCTGCGADIINKIIYEREIINDIDDVEREPVNDKSAIIAICLSLLFGVMVIIMGISFASRYRDANIGKVTNPQIEEESEKIAFNTNSEFVLYNKKYKFRDTVGSYIDSGFSIEQNDDRTTTLPEEEIVLRYSNVLINAKIANENSYISNINNYIVKELSINSLYNSSTHVKSIILLPGEVKFGDSFNDIEDAYGKYDYRKGDCIIYRYNDFDGHIELCFKNELLNEFKIVNDN